MSAMSPSDNSPQSDEPDYRKLAIEVRALIASGTFHAPETIEALQKLAGRFDSLADEDLRRAEQRREVAHQLNRVRH